MEEIKRERRLVSKRPEKEMYIEEDEYKR